MYKLGRELFPNDLEVEHTLWKARRGRVIIENQMEGGMDRLNQNMGEAIRKEENNLQVLNPPQVDPPPQAFNQQYQDLRDYVVPLVIQPVIIALTIQANHFELKPITLQLVYSLQFGGLPSEDPNTHISNFLKICGTMNYNGVIDDAVRLCLFPFSLNDIAKEWLKSQPPASINT